MALALVCGCGARTGLDLPTRDASVRDASVRDAFVIDAHDAALDAGPICGPDVTLLPAHADVLLVLDRSGSMTRALASGGETRWDSLRVALATSLPAFDANVAFGATIFPTPNATTTNGTVCDVGATLDVPIALGAAPAILAAISAHLPSGGTPTASAIELATSALVSRRHVGVPQSIVLATDGGPNCDPSGASQPWYGQAPETCADEGIDPQTCLDTRHSVDRIDTALGNGIPTYVIAMDVTESYLVDALEQMARAGGRARTGSEPFYDVRNPEDLTNAFQDIAARVSSCSFFPDGTVSSDAPQVEVDGTPITRDDSGGDGWTIGPSGTFDLSGNACALAMRTGAVVRVVGACH